MEPINLIYHDSFISYKDIVIGRCYQGNFLLYVLCPSCHTGMDRYRNEDKEWKGVDNILAPPLAYRFYHKTRLEYTINPVGFFKLFTYFCNPIEWIFHMSIL